MTGRPGPELQDLIGEAALVRLAEAFGGTRLYVPTNLPGNHAIVQAVGIEAAKLLVDRLAPDYVRVPLARELRARHYRAVRSWSNGRIATALGMTEPGVNALFRRMADKPDKGSAQGELF